MLQKFLIVLTICTAVSAPVHVRAEGRWIKTLMETHLYALQQHQVELEPFRSPGGAIEPFGNGLLLVTARGRLAQISRLGRVTYLGGIDVPTNRAILESHQIMDKPRFDISKFRIGDILLKENKDKLDVYVSHHYWTGKCVQFRISLTTLELENGSIPTPPTHWKTVFSATPCIKFQEHSLHPFPGHHIGGRMLADGEQHILVVIGDHELDGGDQGEPKISQNPDAHLGKLVRIELATGDAEVLVQGLRVPQGLVRDAKGNLWETEHGPEGGDELNLLIPGSNYGWPEVTFGREYGRRRWPHAQVQGQHSGFTRPVYAWIPSISISAVIVSDGQQFPLWKDDLLIASLSSSSGQSLFRVRLSENRVIYIERIRIDQSIRDMTQMEDGSVALLLDNSSKILFLTRSFEFCKDDSPKESIYATDCDLPRNDYYQNIMSEVGPDPIIRSRWNVYEHKNSLVYMKESCSQEDIAKTFFLHVLPVDEAVLPEHRKQYGFDNLDFDFGDGDLWDGKRCIMIRQLPDYDVSRITTGQDTSGLNRWWIGEHVFDINSPARIDRVPNSRKGSSESSQAEHPQAGAALF